MLCDALPWILWHITMDINGHSEYVFPHFRQLIGNDATRLSMSPSIRLLITPQRSPNWSILQLLWTSVGSYASEADMFHGPRHETNGRSLSLFLSLSLSGGPGSGVHRAVPNDGNCSSSSGARFCQLRYEGTRPRRHAIMATSASPAATPRRCKVLPW